MGDCCRGVFARAAASVVLALVLSSSPAWRGSAATLIVIQADGSASVRPEGGQSVVIPADCVAALEQRLAQAVDPAAVQQAVAEIVTEFAPADGRLAGAIAAYALTLVPEELSFAVIAGVQEGNPDASEEIIVAAGPAPATAAGGGLTDLTSVGGVGAAGTQEVVRSASEID